MGRRGPKSFAERMATAQKRSQPAVQQPGTSSQLPPPPDHLGADTQALWRYVVAGFDDVDVQQLRVLQAACDA